MFRHCKDASPASRRGTSNAARSRLGHGDGGRRLHPESEQRVMVAAKTCPHRRELDGGLDQEVRAVRDKIEMRHLAPVGNWGPRYGGRRQGPSALQAIQTAIDGEQRLQPSRLSLRSMLNGYLINVRLMTARGAAATVLCLALCCPSWAVAAAEDGSAELKRDIQALQAQNRALTMRLFTLEAERSGLRPTHRHRPTQLFARPLNRMPALTLTTPRKTEQTQASQSADVDFSRANWC